MSTRYRSDPEMLEPLRPSKCSRFIYYSWKVIRCLFSHITLVSMVVSYCLFGATAFASLEAANEIRVKNSIEKIRTNVTDDIWNLTSSTFVLHQENWTNSVAVRLKAFEKELLWAMTKDGWDGNEDTNSAQWTFTGALFYSIIVITTIGYGHIAPKTFWGKVVTIFYAILGIPLMLLCLSNIGDIMATSFRFLYWRVCCYVCTKKPKKHRRSRREKNAVRMQQQGNRNSNRSGTASFRRSGRNSQKSADSGFGLSEITPSSFSDNDYNRYHDEQLSRIPKAHPSQVSRFSDSSASTRRAVPAPPVRGGSLDRRKMNRTLETVLDPVLLAKAPVLCNKYVVDQQTDVPKITTTSSAERVSSPTEVPARRAVSVPRQQHFLEPPREPSPTNSQSSVNTSKDRQRRRRASPPHNPSPRIMSPLGFTVHRQKYIEEVDSDLEYSYSDGYASAENRQMTRPVPIWLCVFLVVSYILAGALLFSKWEDWSYLDAAYFCFITLTTIGFGDFVPAKRTNAAENIALCSLYLLFGISLLAMSFNLVQEEVIANVKSVAKTLGIIKNDEEEEDDD